VYEISLISSGVVPHSDESLFSRQHERRQDHYSRQEDDPILMFGRQARTPKVGTYQDMLRLGRQARTLKVGTYQDMLRLGRQVSTLKVGTYQDMLRLGRQARTLKVGLTEG
jgi:hypothetical protein